MRKHPPKNGDNKQQPAPSQAAECHVNSSSMKASKCHVHPSAAFDETQLAQVAAA
jgi:hypothetical protein